MVSPQPADGLGQSENADSSIRDESACTRALLAEIHANYPALIYSALPPEYARRLRS